MARWIEFLFKIQIPVIIMTLLVLFSLHLALAQDGINPGDSSAQAFAEMQIHQNRWKGLKELKGAQAIIGDIKEKFKLNKNETIQYYLKIYKATQKLFGKKSNFMRIWILKELSEPPSSRSSSQLAYLRSDFLPREFEKLLMIESDSSLRSYLARGLARMSRIGNQKGRDALIVVALSRNPKNQGASEAIRALTGLKHQSSKHFAIYTQILRESIQGKKISSHAIVDVLRTFIKHYYFRWKAVELIEELIDSNPESTVMTSAVQVYIGIYKKDRLKKDKLEKMKSYISERSKFIQNQILDEKKDRKKIHDGVGFISGLEYHKNLNWVQSILFGFLVSDQPAFREKAARSLIVKNPSTKLIIILAKRITGENYSQPSIPEESSIETSATVRKVIFDTLASLVIQIENPSQIIELKKNKEIQGAIRIAARTNHGPSIEALSRFQNDQDTLKIILNAAKSTNYSVRKSSVKAAYQILVLHWKPLETKTKKLDVLNILIQSLADESAEVRNQAAIRLQFLAEEHYRYGNDRDELISKISPGKLAEKNKKLLRNFRSKQIYSSGNNRFTQNISVLVGFLEFFVVIGKTRYDVETRKQASEDEVKELSDLFERIESLNHYY